MILHIGERVFWGTPEVMYLEGTIVRLDEATQSAVMHVERANQRSAHLIGADVTFFADGLAPLRGESPPGVTSKLGERQSSAGAMSDDEKVRGAAAALIHQKYGYTLPQEQEKLMIEQVVQAIEADNAMREHIIASMNQIVNREM